MNREIKFRGLALGGKWVYTDKDWVINHVGQFLYKPGHGEGAVVVPLQAGSVGQFTGMKDKNGTDVYEGDFLVRPWPKNWKPETVLQKHSGRLKPVEWESIEDWDEGRDIDYTGYDDLTPRTARELVVLANVYEHPELLEAQS